MKILRIKFIVFGLHLVIIRIVDYYTTIIFESNNKYESILIFDKNILLVMKNFTDAILTNLEKYFQNYKL